MVSIERQVQRAVKDAITDGQFVTSREVAVIVRGILADIIGKIPTGRGRKKAAAAPKTPGRQAKKTATKPPRAAKTSAPKVKAPRKTTAPKQGESESEARARKDANNTKMKDYRDKQKVVKQIQVFDPAFKPKRGTSLVELEGVLEDFQSKKKGGVVTAPVEAPKAVVSAPATRKVLDSPPAPTIVPSISMDA